MPKKIDYASMFTLRADGRYQGYWHELVDGKPTGPRHTICDRDPEKLFSRIEAKEQPAEEVALHAQKYRRAFADARNQHELRDFRGDDAFERAKALQQRVRQRIRVLSWDGVGEQQFEELVVEKRLRAELCILLADALAMAAVNGIRHRVAPCGCSSFSIVDSPSSVKSQDG